MNQNCPPDLRTDEATLEADVERLAKRFGRRLIVTDRFAVAVDSPLRRRGAALAERLRPADADAPQRAAGREGVRRDDALPGRGELHRRLPPRRAARPRSASSPTASTCATTSGRSSATPASVVAHCPTSNLLLGSGVMRLDDVIDRGIPYAHRRPTSARRRRCRCWRRWRGSCACTRARSAEATPAEALYRATRGAGRDPRAGRAARAARGGAADVVHRGGAGRAPAGGCDRRTT